ncbi:MAG TPA: UTP--glucose-1-phosphate uridylyltransferase, partial [Solirubrobacteraceae bacterium]|nr:UTP--glucose-1-phosphate uridylyltransferase [Solirubrobacteraceae bacterium]
MNGLDAGLQKMRHAGMPDAALRAFAHYYKRLGDPDAGALPESALEPVAEIADVEDLPVDQAAARQSLDRAIVLKLNGGLGTSMGLKGPKSLLPVKNGLTFLELIARQILSLRSRLGRPIPLVLMNSFVTDGDTSRALGRHPGLASEVSGTFMQSRFPKLWPDDLSPVSWPQNPALEWAPPGHGDLLTGASSPGFPL